MANETESLVHKGSLWFPESASTVSDRVDFLFYVILWGSVFITAAIVGICIFFLIRYKKTEKHTEAKSHVTHHDALEITWTVVPTIIVMIIFWWGFKDYLALTVPPDDALEIHVTGKKWLWEFEYPKTGAKFLNEVVVPVNTPIKFLMTADDVLHSMFIPNMRVKKDIIPNHYTRLWFEATRTGTFQMFCTEYCGDGHSNMLATLTVLSHSEYQSWLQSSGGDEDLPLRELGQKLYTSKACNTCHSLDGSVKTGPSWKGIFSADRALGDGSSVKIDENYIRESIVNPQAKVVKGFAPVMPTYKGLLSDREINGLIEYIKTLK